MKTKDLYLNTVFNLFPKVDVISAFAYALITTIALTFTFILSYFVVSIVSIIVTAIFSFVVANLFGILLAVVLIASMRKMVLR